MERLTKIHTYGGKKEISIKKESRLICSNFCTRCGNADCDSIRKALYELARLEDMQEKGRLLELPCEIGQRVYEVYRFMGEGAWEIDVHKIRLEDLGKMEKTVFLTREEAEEALKRMEDGNEQ